MPFAPSPSHHHFIGSINIINHSQMGGLLLLFNHIKSIISCYDMLDKNLIF